MGAIALAAAINQLESIGMKMVAEHEAHLTSYSLEELNKIDGIKVYGDPDPTQASERLGVIPFNMQDISHFLVSAILGYEYGVGVRNGCFCAHPYVLHLLNISQTKSQQVQNQIINGDRSNMPGFVRASFGLYNSRDDVDMLMEAIEHILAGKYQGNYIQDRATGDYVPQGWSPNYEDYFHIHNSIK